MGIVFWTIIGIGLILCIIGLKICVYQMHRADEVLAFRKGLINMAYEYNKRRIYEYNFNYNDAFDWFCDKWTTEDMLHSRRPLTLAEWYTEEEIKEIYR